MRMKRDDLRSEVTNKFSKSHSNAMDYSGVMYLEREVGGSNESETSSVQSNLSQIIKDANRRNKRMVYSNCSDEALMDIHKSCRKPHIKRDKCALHPDRSGEHPDRCKDFNHPIGEHSRLCVNKEIHLSAKYVNIHEDQMQHKLFTNKEDNGKGDYFHEMNLSKLGFYSDIIKWDNLKAPDRRELHPIIHERLCSFINPDIILLIDEHEFYCHRIVLQCYSTYFDELNNLEAKNYLKLDKEVTKDAFIAIYAWMLTTGQGGFHYLTRENILQVLIACHHLKVTDLEEQCLAFIDNENAFSEENAFHLFVDASRLKHKAIMELMVPRIKAFFLHLVSSKEFLELSLEDLCIFLQSNYAIVHCEMEMFMSAVRWLMYRWDDRCNYMTNVMRCVRFGLMTPSQLVDIRKNPESPEFLKVTQDKFVQKLIDDGMA
ncbi:hypothetical protein O3M35_010018 [Rhynocoris fuscipes]|uniref:BTB domain-containing protein n=1 Tax=Rhynocoris fuscipes TaxID=488301 RepID=A0AAW1D3L5_9HEMI